MHMLLHLPFLGLALFSSSAPAMTIPQGASLTTRQGTSLILPPSDSSSFNATSNSGFACTRRTTQKVLPRFADCAGALRFLPTDPTIASFYNAEGEGEIQLPMFESYKTCTIIVTLSPALSSVQSSWVAIHAAAMELNAACQDVRLTGLASGFTYVDSRDGIKVTMQGSRYGVGDGPSNATETA